MSDNKIEIEIDGKTLQAAPDNMIIQVADAAGIYIPRFCYHKHLSIAANCRMCLVEVEKSPKTLPACATPVMPGMKVFTRSPKAIAAQKAVMEFLLINHPLDCPICDQGGECELQDLSLGYGSAVSRYTEGKRAVKDENLGSLIATDMTRCIQCTRCVRFGDEIAGLRELGAVGRGEHMEISTYVGRAIQSEVSGNIIDVCPVGALTSKPFRFSARAWELQQYPSIAAHDCIGSNINIHTRNGNGSAKVMRVVPRENNNINETWISDRDRFSYEGLNHADRLVKPRIRLDGVWKEVDWETALEFTAKKLQRIEQNQLAALASPNSTLEEFYLLQKMLRALGSEHIDHRLRQSDFSEPSNSIAYPALTLSLSELEQCDTIVLIGSNIQKEQPIAGLRVRKAFRRGAKIIAVNMLDYNFHFDVAIKKIIAPQFFVHELKENADAIISELKSSKKSCVLVGALAINHPDASKIRALAEYIAQEGNAAIGFLTEGANAAGAWIAGAVPHQTGLTAHGMLNQVRKAYVLMNVEPEVDCAHPAALISALEQAECVVSLSLFSNVVIEQCADVILPIVPFTETAGTFVNAMGDWQSFRGVVPALGEARPAWKVLRVLGNLMHLEGFDYESSEEVRDEISHRSCQHPHPPVGHLLPRAGEGSIHSPLSHLWERGGGEGFNRMMRIGEIPLYAGDSMTRRANALQAAQVVIEGEVASVRMHLNTAKKLAVTEGQVVTVKQYNHQVDLPVIVDARVPEHAVLIAGGILATQNLGELFGPVEVAECKNYY